MHYSQLPISVFFSPLWVIAETPVCLTSAWNLQKVITLSKIVFPLKHVYWFAPLNLLSAQHKFSRQLHFKSTTIILKKFSSSLILIKFILNCADSLCQLTILFLWLVKSFCNYSYYITRLYCSLMLMYDLVMNNYCALLHWRSECLIYVKPEIQQLRNSLKYI